MYKAKNLYDIGRKQGYEEGWAKGYETARDSSIETICDALVMMFAEEGWTLAIP